MHEYALTDHPREKIILVIAVIALLISQFISEYLYAFLKTFMNITMTHSLSLFTIFAIIYFLFNKYIWNLKLFYKLFHFPNLEGEWECTGLSHNIEKQEDFPWEGVVVIKQSWDKILISIRTKNSSSQSISLIGGIKYFPGIGYKLSYHYDNIPNVSNRELRKHDGLCIMTFSEDLTSAEGCYFNNVKDRATYGEMMLARKG